MLNKLPDGHPIKNPGIEAALVRLGLTIIDYSDSQGQTSLKRDDNTSLLAATSHIGVSAISVLPPTLAVVLIDQTREALEKATVK